MILKLGLAIQSDVLIPKIDTPEAFKAVMLRAKTVGLRKGMSGDLANKAFEKLGISKEINERAVYITGLKPRVGQLCREKKAEICIQHINELLETKEIQFVGPFPKELQGETIMATAKTAIGNDKKEVAEFLRYLRSKSLAATARELGLEPAF